MQSIVAFTLDLLLLLTLNVGLGQCRSSGAPAELACAQMVPGHGVDPQTIPCPFETTPNEVVIDGDDSVTLTLKGTQSGLFKGFLVMAFENGTSGMQPIGTFDEPNEGQVIDCSGEKKNAVTHSSPSAKTSVVMKWFPPADYDGDVIFRTTFVESRSTFWVKEPSKVVRVRRQSIVTADVSTVDDLPAASTTTADPTTTNPTTANPTTANPTTANPTTADPTTAKPTSLPPAMPGSAMSINAVAVNSVLIITVAITLLL